jgi:retron-type reverse transcriptase
MGDPHRDLEHLRKLAGAKPPKRFGKVLKVMRHAAFLQMVWQQVRPNKGSRTPGVDGQTKEDVDEHVLHDLAQARATRHYRPQPVRRTYLPKRGKPGQRRG